MDTEQIMDLLKQTADEVIRPRFRALEEGDIETKRSPHDLVTVADRQAEDHLAALLRSVYPDATIVGEETVYLKTTTLDGLKDAEHALIIDPIDGTGNFATGKEEYGVILAETRSGVTTRGWILQPEYGRAFAVERGAGVTLNGERLERAPRTRLPLGAGAKKLVGFDGGGRLSRSVLTKWACAFDYPQIVLGEIDFVAFGWLNPWDHLAGCLMVTELGGVARTRDGVDYSVSVTTGGLIAASDEEAWQAAQDVWPRS